MSKQHQSKSPPFFIKGNYYVIHAWNLIVTPFIFLLLDEAQSSIFIVEDDDCSTLSYQSSSSVSSNEITYLAPKDNMKTYHSVNDKEDEHLFYFDSGRRVSTSNAPVTKPYILIRHC